MVSASTRTCQLDGCDKDLDALGLKATAKYCSPQHRREQNRANGDGNPDRIYVKGHWKQKPRRRQGAPKRSRRQDPALTLIAAALVLRAGQERPETCP